MPTEQAVAAEPDGSPAARPEPPEGTAAVGRPGSRRRRALQWIVPALVLALLDAGGLVWWQRRDPTPASSAFAVTTTRTLAVSPTTLKENVTATGTLAPTVDDTFGFAVPGVVTHVDVRAGQTVKAGQVLATIGTTALAASLAQAKATVAADRATLAADTADSASTAQIAADNATITDAAAAVATAAANLSDATLTAPVAGEITTFGLAVGDAVTGSAAASSGSTAADSTSSRDGTSGAGGSTGVASTASSAGSAASSSSSEVEIVGTTSWQVATTVDDTEIGNLAVGDEATITLSLSSTSGSTTTTGGSGLFGGGAGGFGGRASGTGGTTGTTGTAGSTAATAGSTKTVYGTVTSIGLVPATTTGVAAYPVVVTLTGTSPDLFSGMSAVAAITYRQLTNVLAVPTAAITTSGSTHTVEVSANGRTTRTTVSTGAVVGTETQIVSGLTSGQEIVEPSVFGATGTTRTGRLGGGAGAGGFGVGGFGVGGAGAEGGRNG